MFYRDVLIESRERNAFMSKELQIRNSTVDFLVFTRDAGEDGIEVRVQNGDVWLTQKAISQLFDVDRSVVTKHLSNIFKEGELDENSVCAKFAQTADDGKTYNYKFYSLAAIIAVGYRINSERAMQFRTWATKVLDTFTKQGYVLDKSRLINGQIFDEDYFEHLIAEIQEIRASERRFYQKITDIYATAVDYDKNSQVTREFYATVQNKMHYAVHGSTAAERTEVCIGSVGKYFAVFDLCFVALSWFEFCLPFQIHISGCEQSLIDVCVHGADRHIQFRMIDQDLIG